MPYKASVSDRRAFPRVQTEVPIEIVRPDQPIVEPFAATLLDISQNGAMILSPEPIPTGEWIMMRPDRKGAGFGTEIVAIVDHNLSPNDAQAKLACRFPQPVEYSVLRLFT